MADDKLYSQKEVDELLADKESHTRVETMLSILIDDFRDHKGDDTTRFGKQDEMLNKIDAHVQELVNKVGEVPRRMADHKAAVLEITEEKYVSRKEVKVGFYGLAVLQIIVGVIAHFAH